MAPGTRKPTWLGLRFATERERNLAVEAIMEKELAKAVAAKGGPHPAHPNVPGALLDELTRPLFEPMPRAAAAAEAAFVLTAFALAEGRVLGLDPPNSDLKGQRIKGDRATSEFLSSMLHRAHIPATDGVFQSSTYRAGYRAGHARTPALGDYVDWVVDPGRSIDDLVALFRGLAWAFAQLEYAFPSFPALRNAAFTFGQTRELVRRLRAQQSGGAYEQYLVAALLEQEYGLVHPSFSVETKPVGAPDAAAASRGDVQVTRRRTLVHAIEVSSSSWRAKVRQAGRTATKTAMRQVAIVAPAADLTTEALAAARNEDDVPPAVDIAVVDLDGFLDAVSARLTPPARAAAIRQVYDYLVAWGRTRPDLVKHLVEAILNLELGDAGVVPGDIPGRVDTVARLRAHLDLDDDKVIEVDREDLTSVLDWAEAHLEAAEDEEDL